MSKILQSIKTANGAQVPVESIVTFNIKLGQSSYKCNAYVITGLGHSVVLGRDFLEQNRAIIDLGQRPRKHLESEGALTKKGT